MRNPLRLDANRCGVFTFIARGFSGSERFEQILVVVSIALAGWSVRRGIRMHGDHRVLIVYGAAVVFILLGCLFSEGLLHLGLVLPGGGLFVCSYAMNHRFRRGCGCHHHRLEPTIPVES